MTMYKTLNPKDKVDRLYMSRKEGERGLASIEDSVNTSIQRLEDYIENRRERLISSTRKNTDDTWTNRMLIARKQKLGKKQFYGCLNDY